MVPLQLIGLLHFIQKSRVASLLRKLDLEMDLTNIAIPKSFVLTITSMTSVSTS